MNECECIELLRRGQYKLGFHSGGGHDGDGPCEWAIELLRLINEHRAKTMTPPALKIGSSSWDDIKAALTTFEYRKFTINGVQI